MKTEESELPLLEESPAGLCFVRERSGILARIAAGGWCRRQAEDYSYDEIETESDEACVESEKGVPLGQGQNSDGDHADNHSGEDGGHRGAFPIKAQHHAGEELRDAGVSQQQERYERGRTVYREVQ